MRTKTSKFCLVVPGGCLQRGRNGWRTSNLDEGDKYGVVGDRLRVEAASCLCKLLNPVLVIASGSRGQFKDIVGSPTLALVIKNELVALGVSASKIIQESKSGNTFEQLKNSIKVLKRRGLAQAKIISNAYHLPRVKAMLKINPILRQLSKGIKIDLVAAEKILLAADKKKWRLIIAAAYKEESMKRRLQLERKGVRDLKSGAYKLNRL